MGYILQDKKLTWRNSLNFFEDMGESVNYQVIQLQFEFVCHSDFLTLPKRLTLTPSVLSNHTIIKKFTFHRCINKKQKYNNRLKFVVRKTRTIKFVN